MNPAHTDVAVKCIAELESRGIFRHWIEHGGKHPKLCWMQSGETRRYVLPGSPSDYKAPLAAVSDLRRMLGPKPKKTAPRSIDRRRPAKPRYERPVAVPGSCAVPQRDGWLGKLGALLSRMVPQPPPDPFAAGLARYRAAPPNHLRAAVRRTNYEAVHGLLRRELGRAA